MVKYPYLAFCPQVTIRPIIPNLAGEPLILGLSGNEPVWEGLNPREQRDYQKRIETELGARHQWGLSGYLENRQTLLSNCTQMVSEQRYWHLGLDVIVPAGTSLYAPLDATVVKSGFEPGDGNYGCYVILRHESAHFEPFYSFYGHLGKGSLPPSHLRITAGQPFARVGDFHENGHWFHHTHIQILTEAGFIQGFAFKGYCAKENLSHIQDLCPSPLPLFRV